MLHGERCNRTRLAAQKLIRRLARAIKIHNSVDALLQRTQTAIADMSTVVVVTEENGPGDEILRTNCLVMGAQDLHSLLIAFWPVRGAGAISVLGNDNRF